MVVCVDSQFTANEAYIISVKDIISSSLSLNLHVGKSYVQNVLKGFEQDVILKILREQMNQKLHNTLSVADLAAQSGDF